MSTSFGWEGKGRYGSFISGWTWGVQVKLWDPLRMHAIPECLTGVITTRCYTNPRLPDLTLQWFVLNAGEKIWMVTVMSFSESGVGSHVWYNEYVVVVVVVVVVIVGVCNCVTAGVEYGTTSFKHCQRHIRGCCCAKRGDVFACCQITQQQLLLLILMLLGWLRSTVGGTPVFGRRTDPVLRSTFSRRVTTMWVNRPLEISQLGQLSLSSFRSR